MKKIKYFVQMSLVSIFVLAFVSGGTAQLTSNFQSWLNSNGYGGYDSNYGGNRHGGKASASDTIVNQPVIFIHGNSDAALGSGRGFTGWTSSIDYFKSQGYKTSEIYATTWGDANPLLSAYQGSYTYSIWTTVDEVIGYGNIVYGKYTSQLPSQNGEKRYTSVPYGYINSKDLSGFCQWRMVKFHATN